jgi:Ni,Fe-hydrogenase maturation factor
VVFIDCAVDATAGSVRVMAVEPGREAAGLATHHLDASQLLSLSKELYGAIPRTSLLLTVGAGSVELREGFSEVVYLALPEARAELERAVARVLPDFTG